MYTYISLFYLSPSHAHLYYIFCQIYWRICGIITVLFLKPTFKYLMNYRSSTVMFLIFKYLLLDFWERHLRFHWISSVILYNFDFQQTWSSISSSSVWHWKSKMANCCYNWYHTSCCSRLSLLHWRNYIRTCFVRINCTTSLFSIQIFFTWSSSKWCEISS